MKIDLSSIRNRAKKEINDDTTKIVTKKENIEPSFEASFPNWQKLSHDYNNTKNTVNNTVVDKNMVVKNEVVKNEVTKNEVNNTEVQKPLTENERMKLISILNLYICEFPEKLGKYKNKQLHTMTDENLLKLKDEFHREVCTSNQMGMVVEASKKALSLYEYLLCNMNFDVEGVHRIGDDPEWSQNVKALCLKHMDNITMQNEPEMKLMFLLASGTIMTHQINSMKKTNEKIEHIEENNNETQKNIPHNGNVEHNNIEHKNIEQEEIMKRLQLKSLSNKYVDI